MAINLPRASLSEAPQRKKQQVPLEQILAVMGRNPFAEAINDVGPVLSQALQRRAELRRQAEVGGQLEKLAGQEPGAFNGVPLEVASSLTTLHARGRMEEQENERKRAADLQKIRAFETQFKYKPGELGDDLDAAKTRVLQESISGRQERGSQDRQDSQFKNRLNNQKNRMINDPRIKPFYDKSISIKNIEHVSNLAKNGNTVAASALGAELAKAIEGGGRLTDQDVVRYVSSGRLDRKAADILLRWTTGRPTNATLNEISQIAEVLKERYAEKLQPTYNEYIESFAEVEGLTPDEVSKKMAIPYKPASLQPLPMPGGGGQWDASKEARYQELKRKQQGR